MSAKILLVEDDDLVGTMVRMNLESEGYSVRWVKEGGAVFEAVRNGTYDAVLLDITLPGVDGVSILERLRTQDVGTPVLMLTARSEVSTKVRALDLGADDYLTKPFEVAEMVVRVRALIRRSQAEREIAADRVVNFGDYEINFETREAIANGGPVVLSEKEAGLMRLLMSAGGQPVYRSDILDEVWGMDISPTERTVDNVVVRLRRLFEPNVEAPRHIITVRGIGYRFAP